jgi:SAM-dependent methyltransferase
LDALGDLFSDDRQSLLVLDLACGNLRFERFLSAALPKLAIDFYAVDNYAEGAAAGGGAVVQADSRGAAGGGGRSDSRGVAQTPSLHYQSLDILEALASGGPLSERLEAPSCDLAVAFGFLHHIPLPEQRQAVLASLIEHTRPGGYVAVTFWQFLQNQALAKKARAAHQRALAELQLKGLDALEKNDCLLGWQDTPGAYRYCHSFSQTEIDLLAAAVAPQATPVARFNADGRTNNLNTYLILRVN